ncbi:MAG: response regulator transcription factor [Endomicrobiia bacterium]|nr:response regulator transcription factor [Endomicrobiia bacterium]
MSEKILVVDDEEDYLHILKLLLSSEGYDVDTACDGADGWEKLKAGGYNLAIVDINMPRMDGYQLCGEIRKSETLKETPVIMLTVRSRDEEQIWGLEVGSDDYVTKPFEPSVLVAKIKSVLRRSRQVGLDG